VRFRTSDTLDCRQQNLAATSRRRSYTQAVARRKTPSEQLQYTRALARRLTEHSGVRYEAALRGLRRNSLDEGLQEQASQLAGERFPPPPVFVSGQK